MTLSSVGSSTRTRRNWPGLTPPSAGLSNWARMLTSRLFGSIRGSMALILPTRLVAPTSVVSVTGMPTWTSRTCCSGTEKSTRMFSRSWSVA